MCRRVCGGSLRACTRGHEGGHAWVKGDVSQLENQSVECAGEGGRQQRFILFIFAQTRGGGVVVSFNTKPTQSLVERTLSLERKVYLWEEERAKEGRLVSSRGEDGAHTIAALSDDSPRGLASVDR